MNKSFLVTGGTGFLGRSLVHRLLKEGHRVRVLDNDWRGAKSKLGTDSKEIEFVEADVRNAAAVQKACKKIDVVCHLAFINGTEFFYSMPELVLDVGVLGMVNILHGAIKENVPELVVASSSEVYQSPPKVPTDESVPLSIPDPLNPRYSYGGGKIISELMTLNYGRKYFKRSLLFRPHNVFGPDMGWEHVIPQFVLRMKSLVKKYPGVVKFPMQGSGKETRSFIYIDDFTDGLMKVINKGKNLNIYHIGTMEERSIKSVAEDVGRYFSRKIQIVSSQQAKGGTSRRCPDISKLRALGFKPNVDFNEGLELTANWYNQNSDQEPQHQKKELNLIVS